MERGFSFTVVFLLLVQFAMVSNVSGTETWANSGGGFETDTLAGHISMDDGSTIVVGSYSTAAFFGNQSIEATNMFGDMDLYIGMINSSGNWTSMFGFGSEGADGIDSIALHDSGDIIIAGHYCRNTGDMECQMNFTSSFTVSKDNSSNDGGLFISRISYVNDSFIPIWIRQISTDFPTGVFDLTTNNNGGITLGITFQDQITVGNLVLTGNDAKTLGIIHYDQNGNPIWVNQIYSQPGIEEFGGMCYSDTGFLHIVGTFLDSVEIVDGDPAVGGSDVFVAQLDGDGNFTWKAFAGSTGDDWSNGCAVNSQGDVYVVGQFENTAAFGQINVTSNGWWDMFIGILDSNGMWTSVMNYGNNGWESIESIYIDKNDNVLVAGTHSRALTLGSDQLTDRDGNGAFRDVFIGQLSNDHQWSWVISGGGSGDDIPVSISLGYNDTPTVGFMFKGTFRIGNFSLPTNGEYDIGIWSYARDQDLDGITDGVDNCPREFNPDQLDSDGDLEGDLCDEDDDNDGIADDWDDCSPGELGWNSAPNTDHDSDGCRDVTEDFDDDEDGILDSYDVCPEGPVGWTSTPENDENQDGCEDVDSDGDGYVDQLDKCPEISDNQADLDGDGIGDACEDDVDGDGILDVNDDCPNDSFRWNSTLLNDLDQDGCRDSDRDADDDGDTVLDLSDDCPAGQTNWESSFDHDGDGCHDELEDSDDDADGFLDNSDLCPKGVVGLSGVGMDLDQDGCVDLEEDNDDDNDGVEDSLDDCKHTRAGMDVDAKGCSGKQLDDDEDGILNLDDMCPSTNPGERVNSNGCKIETNDNAQSKDDSEESSSLIWILFSIAGILVGVGLYINFKPEEAEPENADKERVELTVDNGGGQGEGVATSTEVIDSSLDDDATDS